MKVWWRYLEQVIHGVLIGGFTGVLAGCVEYGLFYLEAAPSGNPTKHYWDIVIPYAVIGLVGAW
ncbi:hypothetical protein [Candidatus Entotheonella palauensis]|uniref:Uncharacterized protein n=1 Tax=Candidatus Entotheonella gemina TaxID=1429439 RepID=W4LLE9_9BACT|nr:hypothetical protein [Candidatus Entotheonella palauensis]ETW98913.1 MAG: hypothetical protein ETSY2_41975 [Candidatus Entotheonella gemina]